MNARYLVTAAIVGGIVLFFWGFVTHAVLPAPMDYFKDEQAVVKGGARERAGKRHLLRAARDLRCGRAAAGSGRQNEKHRAELGAPVGLRWFDEQPAASAAGAVRA